MWICCCNLDYKQRYPTNKSEIEDQEENKIIITPKEQFKKLDEFIEETDLKPRKKRTNKNQLDDFYITINEIMASQKYKEQYYICQIINAKKQNPKIKYTQGEVDKNFKLEPILYKARLKKK